MLSLLRISRSRDHGRYHCSRLMAGWAGASRAQSHLFIKQNKEGKKVYRSE